MFKRNVSLSMLPLLLLSLLVGCGGAAEQILPDDLLISYTWREGSLPPPYHYEYTLRLQADGQGEMAMTPDYPGTDVPTWREPFSLSQPELGQLYATLLKAGLFSTPWAEQGEPPIGGSTQTLEVQAGGRRITLPTFPVAEQRAQVELMVAAVQAVVPPELSSDLQARREAYLRARQ